MRSQTSKVSQKHATVINFTGSHACSRVSIIFLAPSQKFKIQVIFNVLAQGKSYEHDFMKKYDDHKLYVKSRVKSSFDRFFVHHLRNLKYWPFQTY
ncbi:hypothetical protein B296_00052926 [Ensete ventricosum]|uniref:Uncharacterized protein n=1 Tax=Ensete ventricosum TaxID=4639 RepID=A0A426X0P4_ENSVE|nr:hypothetical protein B296_00052926 [Ensete ventricosum]